jgi:hypothetical protein
VISRRRPPFPVYDPSTDSSLALWLDANDSSTNSLLDTTSTSISNGETIGTWKSKKGTARSFTQWGTNGRPTWDSTGINGLGAVRFATPQILATTTSMGDFASMSAITVMLVQKLGTFSSSSDCSFATMMFDNGTGKKDISQVYVTCRNDGTGRKVGGRRARGDSFASIASGMTPTNPYILTGVWNYSSALITNHVNGVKDVVGQTFQTSGTTDAADPSAISVGAMAQETSTNAGNPFDGWIGEVLVWLSAMTPDQLVPAHHYLRRKWGVL